jgi:protein subunit release factor A
MGDEAFKIELIYRGTGTTQSPGGQHAGIRAADVRVTHIPTGIMAQCGEARSQHQNRKVAMEMIEWALSSFGFAIPK